MPNVLNPKGRTPEVGKNAMWQFIFQSAAREVNTLQECNHYENFPKDDTDDKYKCNV